MRSPSPSSFTTSRFVPKSGRTRERHAAAGTPVLTSAAVKTALKQALRRAWRAVPGKGVLVRTVALAPPALKGPRSKHVLSRLIERDDLIRMGAIDTNLGLPMPSISIDGRALPQYFFGRPDHFEGERGPLALSTCLTPHCDAFVDIGANHGYFIYVLRHELGDATPIHYLEP